ncbi:hypothetical protein ACTVPT_26830 [Serratia bockelmannii]|uniref:hypothetical protein n=1 Tax=Serratia TaxID=613 RepID=UPI00146D5648|nr:hypothetical protein [Serratia marcescens]NMT27353.1 hypothetical protein [Serratia marcescens]
MNWQHWGEAFLFMQQTKVEKLPVRRSGRVDKFPVEGDRKRVEGFHVHVMSRIEILFCIQIVLVPVFLLRVSPGEREGEYSGYFYGGRYFLFVCGKGGEFICGGSDVSGDPDIAVGKTRGIIS